MRLSVIVPAALVAASFMAPSAFAGESAAAQTSAQSSASVAALGLKVRITENYKVTGKIESAGMEAATYEIRVSRPDQDDFVFTVDGAKTEFEDWHAVFGKNSYTITALDADGETLLEAGPYVVYMGLNGEASTAAAVESAKKSQETQKKPKESPKTEEKKPEKKPAGAAAGTGDTVSIDYVGSFEDGTVFTTSLEAVAKQADIHNPLQVYEPMKFTLGADEAIDALDAAVNGMKMGETKTFVIPAEAGYGQTPVEKTLPRDAVEGRVLREVPEEYVADRVTLVLPKSSFNAPNSLEPGAKFEISKGAYAEIVSVDAANVTILADNVEGAFYGKPKEVGTTGEYEGNKLTIEEKTATGYVLAIENPESPFYGQDLEPGLEAKLDDGTELAIIAVSDTEVTVSMSNPEMFAGKDLTFKVTVVGIVRGTQSATEPDSEPKQTRKANRPSKQAENAGTAASTQAPVAPKAAMSGKMRAELEARFDAIPEEKREAFFLKLVARIDVAIAKSLSAKKPKTTAILREIRAMVEDRLNAGDEPDEAEVVDELLKDGE